MTDTVQTPLVVRTPCDNCGTLIHHLAGTNASLCPPCAKLFMSNPGASA